MTIVSTVEQVVSIGLDEAPRQQALRALNQHHYGAPAVPLAHQLSHFNLNRHQLVRVLVDVYEDGSTRFRVKDQQPHQLT